MCKIHTQPTHNHRSFLPSDQRKHLHFPPNLWQILGFPSHDQHLIFHFTFFFLRYFGDFAFHSIMSSLLREEMQRVLFQPEKHRLVEFIEIEEPSPGRHFLCVSGKLLFYVLFWLQMKILVTYCIPYLIKNTCTSVITVGQKKVVQLSIVHCQMSKSTQKSGSKKLQTKRSSIQECYKRIEIWSLHDLTLVDGRDPDVVLY